MVANLPYNVAAPMVLRVLDEAPMVRRISVLVQREVGERLVAPAGSGTYGIPSVKVAYWATGSVVAKVPAAVFHPVPRVDSVVVRIERRAAPATDADPEVLFALVRRAFGQRRKMLRRSLAGVVDDAHVRRCRRRSLDAPGASRRGRRGDVCAAAMTAAAGS